jgi:chromodomain-helicase-DNA-binding protein 7
VLNATKLNILKKKKKKTGAEDAITAEYIEEQAKVAAAAAAAGDTSKATAKNEKIGLKAMVQASGKLVLVDKLLPKLKAGGHKVLIFSQMIRVLDIIEDYLIQNRFTYERIDGRIRGDLRQEAIERYSKPDSDRFVFLLCTRAGGLGINLTAADTVIIYDSDWNPQNDLQAQARCHRIGQRKAVKIYRLITRNTYEREMFDKASLKLGLDKAVLQSMRADDVRNNSMPLTKLEIEELLKKGAYGAIMDADDNAADKFCEEDIDKILQQRSTVITIEGGEKGSTFSKASFQTSETNTDISLDDPEFWQKWARKADINVEEKLNPKDERIIYEPRRRTQTRRYGGPDDLLEESDYSSSGSDNENGGGKDGNADGKLGGKTTRSGKRRGRSARAGDDAGYDGGDGGDDQNENGTSAWSRDDCYKVEKNLMVYGWARWSTVLRRCEPIKKKSQVQSEQDVESLARTICAFALKNYHGEESIRQFILEMVDPAKSNFDALKSHQGLAAPIPRGRRKAVENAPAVTASVSSTSSNNILLDETMEWAKNADELLGDEGYKRHLIRQASKILLRLRTLFYIKHEIIGDDYAAILDKAILSPEEDEAINYEEIDLKLPAADIAAEQPLADWWDVKCDQCLLIGVYKHGFERYYQIRVDPKLCFLSLCGLPDAQEIALENQEAAAAASNNNENEEAKAEEATEEPSTTTAAEKKEAVDDEEKSSEAKKDDERDPKKESSETAAALATVKHFPSHHELNNRMRKLIAIMQRQKKQAQMAEKRDQDKQQKRSAKQTAAQERASQRQQERQAKWSRREEQNFYKAISTFGVDSINVDEHLYSWERFKEIGGLEKKLDETLGDYLHSFMLMCKRVCNKMSQEECDQALAAIPPEQQVQVEQITEERASRCLQRVDFLNRVRGPELAKHEKFAEWLDDAQLLPGSPDLPDWYMPGRHDRDLVKAASRYGITRTEHYYLNDPEFSFREYLDKYMRHIERMMDEDNEKAAKSGESILLDEQEQPIRRHTDPVQYYFQNQVRIQHTFRQQVIEKELGKCVRRKLKTERILQREERAEKRKLAAAEKERIAAEKAAEKALATKAKAESEPAEMQKEQEKTRENVKIFLRKKKFVQNS